MRQFTRVSKVRQFQDSQRPIWIILVYKTEQHIFKIISMFEFHSFY